MDKRIVNKEEKFSKVLVAGIGIGFIGALLRIIFFPYEIPITLDGLLYFWYGLDAKNLGGIPPGYIFPNNFWPLFLGGIFYLSNFENYFDLMNLQRSLSTVFSVLTFIPVYYLLRKFFEQKYALIGLLLFALQPRLIINSFAGLPESMFVFLGSSTLVLFLSNKMRLVYSSFVICALFSLVRYEGIFLVIPLSMIFLIRFRKESKILLKFLLAITIFILTITPMTYLKMETTGQDGFYSHIGPEKGGALNITITGNDPDVNYDEWIKNFLSLLALSVFPIFFIFLPYGIKSIIKKDEKNLLVIITIIMFLLPTLYISVRGIQETKYLLILYPIFSILSVYTIQRINEKIRRKNLFLFIVFFGVIIVSTIFLTLQIDNEHEREAMVIAEEINKRTYIINDYHPESVYLRTVILPENISNLSKFDLENMEILFTEEHDTLKDFLEFAQKQKLEYLIVDNKENRVDYIRDIFENEEKYAFLEKDYDSINMNFEYKVKIFKINYEKFYENFN